ncbi:hypothetical protein BYT27DRAFT_7159048 [Phlegmacium glaucopus]|nr:hypothetical protein BYT27DRAFT_7159048 [Phlegmacium glaucopus]
MPTPKFKGISELRSALRSQIPEVLTEALTSIRNQLTVQPQDTAIPPQDDRLIFLKQWLESSPGAQDLFGIWDKANPRQPSFLALVVSLTSSIMALLSFHYTDYSLGQPIMKTLLNPSNIRRLQSYIGSSHNELIIVTLKLFNVMSKFAGGQYRKFVLESFPWELKSLPKLLNMRRKSQGTLDRVDPLTRPDIRTLYVLLLLSFVDSDNTTQTKTTFIEQHREPFLAIFKGISQDHYSLVRRVLEVCWAGIWSDAKLKRTLKIGLFNEMIIGHLIKLYDRHLSDDEDDDHVPANLVHHFLLATCTRPGTGICFKDRGWYPRDSDPDDIYTNDNEESKRKTSRIYNKILANVLKTLKVNEDSRQQELATKIMMACPELVAGFWSSAALTLEPRLSSKWITNIGFFGCIISLPVPSASFYLPSSQFYQPTPPSLSTLIENILPSVQTKIHFSKGLLSSSGLVQHCTALALTKCLVKYQVVDAHLRKVAHALEEDDEDGQWRKRRRELEREVRRRVPDFQVVVAFSHQKHPDVPGGPIPQPNPTKKALLAESAQRLLWLYHCSLPSMVAEAHFELGKLLQTFTTEGGSLDQEATDAASRLYRVQQLHILKLLNDSDQFVWTSKIGSLTHSPFCILLRALASATIPAIRSKLSSLLRHVLSQSILFQEDPHESDLWLKALPTMRPSNGEGEVADGGPLLDEADAVIMFLDDCVQRCLKTPYRYLEDVRSLAQTLTSNAESEPNYSFDIYPSSLLMTIVEQLDAKVANKLLIPSHILGITSFIRKLLFYLSSKQSDLQFLHAVAAKIDEIFSRPERLFEGFPIFSGSIRREVGMLRDSLTFRHRPLSDSSAISSSTEVQAYLDRAEQVPLPVSKQLRAFAALELVDWMRTVPHPLGTRDLKRLIDLVIKVHLPTIHVIQEYWTFERTDLWEALDVLSRFSDLRPYLNFEWLFLHAAEQQIMDKKHQTILSDAVFTHMPTLVELTQVLHLVMHAIAASRPRDEIVRAQLSIIASIFQQSKNVLPVVSLDSLKEFVFVRPGILKDVMMTISSTEILLQGVQSLSEAVLNPASENDRKLASDISYHWLTAVKGGLDGKNKYSVLSACMWIRYLESPSLLDLLDVLEGRVHHMPTLPTLQVTKTVLEALKSRSESELTLKQRLPQLLSLRSVLPDFLLLEDLIAIAIEASLPIGLDGSPLFTTTSNEVDFVTVINRANTRWSHRTHTLAAELDIRQFLNQDKWSDSTVRIISALVYRQCESVVEWLGTESCSRRQIYHLLPIFHAVLDSSLSQVTSSIKSSVWLPYISPIVSVLADQNISVVLRKLGRSCIINILSNAGGDLSALLAVFTEEVNAMTEKTVSLEIVSLGVALASRLGKAVSCVISILVDRGMQWLIDQYQLVGDHETMVDKQLADELGSLIKLSSVSKPHLVETLLTVIIQGRFSNVSALKLAVICLSSTQLKPLIVNRHLQNIIQHPHFYKLCTNVSPEVSSIRDAIIELLHSLFHLHPTNTCQITHIEPIVPTYRGTLSLSDLRILSILQLFENQRKLSITSLLSRWSSTSNASSQSALEALQSLDPILVLRTCLNLPRWRCVEDQSALLTNNTQDAHLYDPVFVMLLFGQMLADQPPSSAFAWLELFRSNVVSLFIRVLSSKDGQMRELALCQVVALWKQMEHADFQEKPHVLYILNMLKDTIRTHSNEPPNRLPSYTTLILMHALRGIFYPSNFIYPLTARFLLQRPELDTTDVPMLYGMLYSSSDDWRKERGWIIRFLSDGMMSTEDWRVLKRRHTWELLASLYQSSESDIILRQSILEVLANLTCNAQATNSLVLKFALLSWIEIQILHSTLGSIAWIKILENILIVVDSNKIEASTNGEWRSAIGRCIEYLVDEKSCPTALENLTYAAPVILRLSLLPGSPLDNLSTLLDHALHCLDKFEKKVDISSKVSPTLPTSSLASLHRSSGLHQPSLIKDPLLLWGSMVEMLWRSAMTQEQKCPAWDLLTPKLLVWRTIVDGEGSQVGEWARTEVLRIVAFRNTF